jgi:hypothetical protein
MFMPRIATSHMGTAWHAYEQDTRTEFELPNAEPVTPTASIGDTPIVRKRLVVSDMLATRTPWETGKKVA